MENFTIYSSSSNRALTFSNFRGDSFQIDLKGTSLSASLEVHAYTDAHGLNRLFQDLAASPKPWSGAREWKTLEGDFSISATCSALGTVLFRIVFRMLPGHPEESSISTGISSEFGRLLDIAKESERFFGLSHNQSVAQPPQK